MKNINIAFIADEKYALPTRVAVRSVMRNKSVNDNIKIHIIAVDMPDMEIEKFKNLGDINVIRMDKISQQVGWDHSWVSRAALLKFRLPDILGHLGKVLYLDGDIIATGSLADLYNTDISNVYGAVIIDSGSVLPEHQWHKALGLDSYFNSGVMLLNLKKMRADKITDKLIEHKKNDTLKRFMDQDAFNAVFGHYIIYAPAEYNVFNKCLTDNFIPKIIHYATGSAIRPWTRGDIQGIEIWRKYLDVSDRKIVDRTYRTTQKAMRRPLIDLRRLWRHIFG